MNSSESMKQLLRPLGVYRLEGSFLGAELETVGAAFDRAQEYLDEIQREMCLITAQDKGVKRMAALFSRRPETRDTGQMAASLAALTRISGDSFTLAAINGTVAGCGLNARVIETAEPGVVAVMFPQVAGQPEGFERIRVIVEDILPAHLAVRYIFWYQVWSQLEARGWTWQQMAEQNITWTEFQNTVE